MEDRTVPSANPTEMAALRQQASMEAALARPFVESSPPAPVANPAFDTASGRALPGNKSRISDPLLRLYNAWLEERDGLTPVDFPAAERLQIDVAGNVIVRVTGRDISTLRPDLEAIGFHTYGSAPNLHIIEGYLPITALPQADALSGAGLLGVMPIRRPSTSLGTVTSQADFVLEADRVRNTSPPPFINGTGVQIGVLSDSFDTNTGAATHYAQDLASGDLPTVTVLKEGPANSTDEGRAMLQLIHDVATGSTLSFASAFFGEVDFGNQIKALQANGAAVIVDDIFYFEEPQYQDGMIAQAITDVVNNHGVSYYSAAGNNGTQVFEGVGWAGATDPGLTLSNCYDFDPGAGVDTRQRITIPTGGNVNLTMQWDDPFYTASGVDTDMDIYLIRSDTGVVVASGTDFNVTTQVPSENFGYNNNTGQTSFDIVVRVFAGPNPGRFKWVNLNSFLQINEWDPGVAGNIVPHAAAVAAEGVGAIPYFDQTNIEGFTSRGPNVVVFDTAGNPIAPQTRIGVYVAAIDGVNTTFFGGDTEGDGFPNFFGTSAAAPNAAAVAAMYLQLHPGTNPFSVYGALESSADASVFTPGFDTRTGNGRINAYDAIVGFPVSRATDFPEGFETAVLSQKWETRSTGAGHIQVTSANGPASGAYHATMDSAFNSIFSLNELTLHADLANTNNAILTFDEKEFSDEDDVLPATFAGSVNADGVALSVDGVNWFRVVSLTGANSTNTYQTLSFNLSQIAADNFVSLTSNTLIKFQQYDNNSIASDGIALDNVQISRTGTISGISYDDTNSNGVQDGVEAGRPNSTVYVDSNFNGRFDQGNTVTFASAQLPAAIRDLQTVRVPLTISGFGGTISLAAVNLDISHTFDSDLIITLISPVGARVVLSNRNGGADDSFTGTTFDDNAATAISAGVAPFTGRFRPDGVLSSVNGQTLSGTWYLEVADVAGGDVGTINSWSLTLSRDFVSADVPKTLADFTTANSTILLTPGFLVGVISDINVSVDITHSFDSDLTLVLSGPGGKSVTLAQNNGGSGDNYSGTVFDDQAATGIAAGVAPFTGRFHPVGNLADFNGLSPNATWTLSVTDGAGGDTGTLNGWTLQVGRDFSQDVAPIPIPDKSTVTTTLPAANLTGLITGVEVNLDLTHTFDSDLTVFLTSPAGTKVQLIAFAGGDGDNFTGTTLDDQALVPVDNATAPFTGIFRPPGSLAAFNGQNPNGTWTLTVTDNASNDVGTIVDWSVAISSTGSASVAPAAPITDYQTSFASVFMSGMAGFVNDVNVSVDITHTFDADLNLTLIGPNGARVPLTNRTGGSGDNFIATIFDDQAAVSVTSGSAPFTGSFRPVGQLSLFNGIDPNGFWSLEVSDNAGGDTGTINSFGITIGTGELYAITDAKGEYTLPNLSGTYRVREVLPAGRYHTQPVPDNYDLTVDHAANAALVGKDFGSVADVTPPTAIFTAVSPDPRNTPVSSIQIVFSEPVTGLDLSDLILDLNGGPNLLTGAQTLTTSDNVTWTLGNLTGLTGTDGNYFVQLFGGIAGVVDRAGNACTQSPFDDWRMDTTAPTTSSIVRADPNPTPAASVDWTVTFSEPVSNVQVSNFTLVNGGLSGSPAITGVSGGGTTWTVTASTGTGNGLLGLDMTAAGSVVDTAGNALTGLPVIGEVYAVNHGASPAKVSTLLINGGAAQRSRVTSLELDFDQIVTLPATPETAFQLKRTSDSALVTLAAAVTNVGQTKVTLTFTGGAVNADSLADGRYTLTVFAASVSNANGALDGNGDGTGGDDYVLIGDPTTNKLVRLFGDNDGDGDVDAQDFSAFRGAFGGTNNLAFDSDNDGDVDAGDFAQFRQRFGSSV